MKRTSSASKSPNTSRRKNVRGFKWLLGSTGETRKWGLHGGNPNPSVRPCQSGRSNAGFRDRRSKRKLAESSSELMENDGFVLSFASFGYSKWGFESFEEAKAYGVKAGFSFSLWSADHADNADVSLKLVGTWHPINGWSHE